MTSSEPTTVGNFFISNYPPYSFWREDMAGEVDRALAGAPSDGPVGLYVHLPFCRKRCDFCYYKVYTDKNSAQIRRYLDGLLAELDAYVDAPYLAGRPLDFVYFGGGTPSYLSSEQLRTLFEGLRARMGWDAVREVAFECEPGTLQEGKVHLLKELGVTRLSLGVENFDADILELNNRAHRAVEIERSWGFIRDAGFQQVNLDLIAGMVGETDENWTRCIEETIELDPDCVTIYQMEVPYNTTIYERMKDGSERDAPVADWPTKRRWVTEAWGRLEAAGYTGFTMPHSSCPSPRPSPRLRQSLCFRCLSSFDGGCGLDFLLCQLQQDSLSHAVPLSPATDPSPPSECCWCRHTAFCCRD